MLTCSTLIIAPLTICVIIMFPLTTASAHNNSSFEQHSLELEEKAGHVALLKTEQAIQGLIHGNAMDCVFITPIKGHSDNAKKYINPKSKLTTCEDNNFLLLNVYSPTVTE